MASSKLKSAFKVALEEIKQEEAQEPTLLEGGDDSLEAELIAVQESEHEAEDAQEIVEELEDVAEGLESICNYLEASLENGGLEPSAAGAVALAMNAYTRRLGVDEQLIPSQEAFGGASDREQATTVSIEAAGDKLKAVWAAIKQAVINAWKAVATFFTNIFSAVGKAESRIASLEKSVKDLGDKQAGSDDIKVSALADPKAGDDVVKVLGTVLGDLTKAGVAYFDNIGKLVVDGKVVKAETKDDLEEAEKGHLEAAYAELDKVSAVLEGTELPGGAKFEVTRKENGSVTIAFNSGSGNEQVDRKPLSVSEMNAALSQAKKLVDVVKKNKSSVDALKKAAEGALKNAEKLSKDVDAGRVTKILDQAKARGYLSKVQKGIAKPVSATAGYGLRVATANLTAVERSLKTYKVKEEKKDEE